MRNVSTEQYRAHLDQLRQMVADCARLVTECDPARVGDDDLVHPASGSAYTERYGWLRDLLVDKNDPSHSLRNEMLPRAEQRLAEQEAELDSPAPALDPLSPAEKSARATILSRSEFRTAQDYTLTERIGAWISEMLSRLFGGIGRLGAKAPWLGLTVEWGSLVLAAALLALWIYRTLDRQRTALGRLTGDGARSRADAESRAWAEKARGHADRGEWRDAVHCLYWASIVALEDRRTLRPNRTRTPREALRLIDPASHLREPLRLQTVDFERIWYGLQAAQQDDYQRALQQHEALQAGRAQAVPA